MNTQKDKKAKHAYVIATSSEKKRSKTQIQLKSTNHPMPNGTISDLGLYVRVAGPKVFEETILVQPFDDQDLVGIDPTSVKMFYYDEKNDILNPVWNSGINKTLGFIWAKISQPGVYLPLGLPRDRLLQEILRVSSFKRSISGAALSDKKQELISQYLAPFLEMDKDALEELRQAITQLEIATTHEVPLTEFNIGMGGHLLPFHLPGGMTMDSFRKQIKKFKIPGTGFPEEQLFRPPEISPRNGYPWALNPETVHWDKLEDDISRLLKFDIHLIEIIRWFFSKDWPMYQHDTRHSGVASGSSSINSTTVGQLTRRFKVNLDGPVNSKPSIVNNYTYIGTSRSGGGTGGTLYKINNCSGYIAGRFPTPADPHFYPIHGIGGSPAIYNGKAYFTTVAGKVYCVDTATMTPNSPHPPALWITDLKNPSALKNQPVRNPRGDCWSSPLVVNDKVYVGSGEGEDATTWGFIWCLDANTGQVIWLFCTNKRQNIGSPGTENQPNRIPRSAAVSDPLPAWAVAAGFSIMNDPPETGSSPWSSFAYDYVSQQVYIGTGNSQYPNAVAPDQRYGSGLIALDATTGQFKAFHTSQPDDSYHPQDTDIDVPGAPTVFTRGNQRVVCYGSKNGSFFLLNAANLQVLGSGAQRRQLLPRLSGTGHPGSRGNPIAGVATSGGVQENKWGVMATPSVVPWMGKIFIGLGGYSGAGDGTKTPFIRALDWNNLNDAWPTVVGADGVTRYSAANPPLYIKANEAALSSPAVVNDVVFVSTTSPANTEMSLYALDADTGLCLWASAKIANGGWPNYALGPAISGEYVVQGAGESCYIYTRPTTPWCFRLQIPWYEFIWKEPIRPWPPPEELITILNRLLLNQKIE